MAQTYSPVTGAAVPDSVCPGSSAVAWPAILAGAVVAAVTSLALLLLGSSFGLAVASPWSDDADTSATAVTVGIVIWMIIMQWVSAALGGYLTGRLRIRWNTVHNDEVFFRDTAHGFLTWAVATLITAAFLASAASCVASMGAKAASHHMGPAHAQDRRGGDSFTYEIDKLYRSSENVMVDPGTRGQAIAIARHALMDENGVSDSDKAYLAQTIVRRTGVSQSEANARVSAFTDQIESVKAEADDAREAAATVAIFTFLSMLVGAFIASVAAALGGRQRDYI